MTTIGYDPVLSDVAMRAYDIEPCTLEALLKESDFITIHTPKTRDTTHLINTESIQHCKQGVKIINCARGGIIDEAALLAALERCGILPLLPPILLTTTTTTTTTTTATATATATATTTTSTTDTNN